jgi:hypothetical protein
MSLHVCELLVNLARDESIWRAASLSDKGTWPVSNPLQILMTSWHSLGLLVFKPVVHWLFGRAMKMDDTGLNMSILNVMHECFFVLLQPTKY